ncbi:hypothetical protein HELRODRAFT_188137 [Helobdella robusta]|uniref:Uncharacterized protein n=1 Tax=Helobdella robusta TaxID=6412 RepID=T1FPP1_HELRO|nr:hypothetical protein HELRODRAFT_188137 [Helobdella robusta]ESO13159.1 hypothetical protein HELRODRAFT_188137 [Helobdella robusta]
MSENHRLEPKYFSRIFANLQYLKNNNASIRDSLRNDSERNLTFYQKSFSSLAGSTLTALAVTPLDVVKIRLQAQHKILDPHHYHHHPDHSIYLYRNGLMDFLCECNHCRENPRTYPRSIVYRSITSSTSTSSLPSSLSSSFSSQMKFSGTRDAFLKIVQLEGITSLWSGLGPTLVLSLPLTICYFPLYDMVKYRMGYDEQDPKTAYIPPLAGSLCRALMVTLFNPLELFRTKLQSKKLTYPEMAQAIKITFSHSGFGFVFSGLAASLLRDVPFSAIYWYGYERIKAERVRRNGGQRPLLTDCFVAGAISGSIAAILTLPFDVIKTHRQIELGTTTTATATAAAAMATSTAATTTTASINSSRSNSIRANRKRWKVPSTMKMIERLYREKGIKGLFAGSVPRLVKVAPACAIMIGTYEGIKTFFIKYNIVSQRGEGLT